MFTLWEPARQRCTIDCGHSVLWRSASRVCLLLDARMVTLVPALALAGAVLRLGCRTTWPDPTSGQVMDEVARHATAGATAIAVGMLADRFSNAWILFPLLVTALFVTLGALMSVGLSATPPQATDTAGTDSVPLSVQLCWQVAGCGLLVQLCGACGGTPPPPCTSLDLTVPCASFAQRWLHGGSQHT